MSTFLYFFPNRPAAAEGLDWLPESAAELRTVLAGATWSRSKVNDGPGRAAGGIVSILPAYGSAGVQATCGYFPERQRWVEFTGPDKQPLYWAGYETASPPRPVDLIRPRTIPGMAARLADGNDWIVPLVHSQIAGELFTSLPRTLRCGAAGQAYLQADDSYAEIVADSARLWETVATPTAQWPLSELETLLFDVRLLAINYRLGLVECSALGLLNTLCKFAPIYVALGLDAVGAETEAQKKTDTPPSGTAA